MSNASGLQEVRVTGFEAELAQQILESADHANDEHSDTVRLLARYGGEQPRSVADAQFAAIDPDGVEMLVVDDAGNRDTMRLPFPSTATSTDVLWEHLFGAVYQARQAAPPEEPMTLLEEELAEEATRHTFLTSVVGVRDISPNIREVTFRGGLEHYETRGAGEFLTVIVARAGHEELLTADLDYAALRALPEDERPEARTYTARNWRPEAGELDVWFVLHGQPSIVADWAHRAQPGDHAGIRGPGVHLRPPEGTTHLVLLGDETFLPAVAATLEHLDAGVIVEVVIETVDAAHEVPLPARPGVSVRWVHRGSAPAGTSGVLLDAVRSLAVGEGAYIAGGGEAKRMAEVRRHLRGERGLPVDQVSVVGYWRREDV